MRRLESYDRGAVREISRWSSGAPTTGNARDTAIASRRDARRVNDRDTGRN